MNKTREEISNMTEDESWKYLTRPNPRPLDKGGKPPHFKTKEEWRAYYSDGHEVSEFMKILRNKYGI